MLKGFKNAVDVDFTIEENRVKMEEAFKQVDAEKGSVYPLIIGGERIETEKKITSLDPSNKEVLGYACSCSQELAEKAILTAQEAFKTWSVTPVEERVRCLRKLATLLIENRFYIDAWNVSESGKKWDEADGELCEQLDFINSYAMHMLKLDEGLELVPTDEYTKCVYIPIGVGVAVPPWNFPISLMGGMIASSVVTGNAMVVKPSSNTPICAYKFIELCEKAGIPAGVVNYIPGSGSEIGDYIVDSSANIKKAAQGVASSAFTFQGQKCSACSRAIVMSDVYDEFAAAVVEEAKKLKADQGSGREDHVMGPVIDKSAYDSITGYIEVAREEGDIAFGGTYSDEVGYYIDPTVVLNIKRDARIANEEIFGPVLAVIKVDSFDEALDVANQTEYGLTGSVYSENRANIRKAKVEFNVGNLYFNRKSTAAVVLQHPFGGFNMSGTDAKTGTADYLTNFLNLKSVTEDLTD